MKYYKKEYNEDIMYTKKEKQLMILLISASAVVILTVLLLTVTGSWSKPDTDDDIITPPVVLPESETDAAPEPEQTKTPKTLELDLPIEWQDGEYGDDMKCKIKTITLIDNIHDAGISLDDLDVSAGIHPRDREFPLYHPYSTESRWELEYYVDADTGELADSCYIYLLDIEMTNINAKNKGYIWGPALPNVFSISSMPIMVVSGNGKYSSSSNGLVYFSEANTCPEAEVYGDTYSVFKLNIGETKEMTVGYLIYDDFGTRFERAGFIFDWKWEIPFNENYVLYWFDMSSIVPD